MLQEPSSNSMSRFMVSNSAALQFANDLKKGFNMFSSQNKKPKKNCVQKKSTMNAK
jgi:hypothetical protein